MDSNIKLSHTLSANTSTSKKALNFSVHFWFILTVIGQWFFAFAVSSFYGSAAALGNFEKWTDIMPHGYVEGEPIGNIAVGIHLLLAVIVLIGGPLQLVPAIRKAVPKFHQWTGRVYIFTAFLISGTGLFMVWTRGTVGGLFQHISISINALAIIFCAIKAWQYAMARDFQTHGEWAIRLFLVMSGVWFFRVGLMMWLLIFQEPVGFDPDSFEGPFLYFLGNAQYILPVLVFELYLRAKKGNSSKNKWAFAILLFVLTGLMGLGIVGAVMGMWSPML